MAKGQKRGNREPKKPKQKKAPVAPATAEPIFADPGRQKPKRKPAR